MELPVAVLGCGALLLLVGLVGGDLSRRGTVVPRVGPLPRGTTTLAGSGVVLLGLVVLAGEASVPAGTPVSGTTLAGASQPAPVAPAPGGPVPVAPVRLEPAPVEAVRAEPVPSDPIVVTVVDRLGAGQAAQQVEVEIDGAHVGGLSTDPSRPTAVLEVPLDAAGSLRYEVAVVGVSVGGEPYTARGAAAVDVEDGSTLHLDVDPTSGDAVLVRGAAVR